MLMVVLGAGASYDSAPDFPPSGQPQNNRPPLANELFERRESFVKALDRFSRCKDVVPQLRNVSPERSLESELDLVLQEAKKYPSRHGQLLAIRFYLQEILSGCVDRWQVVNHGVTNHRALIDRIRLVLGEEAPVCFVTFNYDMMLEKTLDSFGIRMETLDDYVSQGPYKVMKLHGSVSWGQEVDTPLKGLGRGTVWRVVGELLDKAPVLEVSTRYVIATGSPPALGDGRGLVPALALPVQSKQEFVCPAAHVEALKAAIPKVTNLLVIGWRATEPKFLNLLKDLGGGNLRITVVAGDSGEAGGVARRIAQAGVRGSFEMTAGGFTEFILDRGLDSFLRTP